MTSSLPLDSVYNGGASPLPQTRRPTLLIVDDEEGPRQSLQVIFKDDYDLVSAGDGATALDLAQQHKIDVAVLDVRMAGMSGIELLERLRYVDPSIEAVMMTAFETTETMRQALRLRACDYINKPFDISTIRAAVHSAMERRSLGAEVRKNTETLRHLQTELQQQKVEGEIYACIIHDINGPLTIISGLIQMINERIGTATEIAGEDLEQAKDRLKRITRQVTNCIEISRRYLSFLRPNPPENLRVWANQILGDVGELLRVNPSTRNNQLLIHPLPEDATVVINGTDLIQILLNLTLNALQCTAQYHRVEIVCQLLTHPLDLSHFQDGPEDRFINREGFRNQAPLLTIAVQDNGPGIQPDVLPQIFEPYFTTKPRMDGAGTGLGLCIVHRLLCQANGALHVHTKVGQGTVFTVYLPARMAGPEPTFRL